MDLQEALETALTFEHRIRDHYTRSAAQTADPKGRQVFETLAREEQGHVDYLNCRLEEWKATGAVKATPLATLLPPNAWVQEHSGRHLEGSRPVDAPALEMDLLKDALDLERKTSAFYEALFAKLPAEHRALFERFLEIEQGHVLIVQAEIDALAGHGHWFDFMEFRLEQ